MTPTTITIGTRVHRIAHTSLRGPPGPSGGVPSGGLPGQLLIVDAAGAAQWGGYNHSDNSFALGADSSAGSLGSAVGALSFSSPRGLALGYSAWAGTRSISIGGTAYSPHQNAGVIGQELGGAGATSTADHRMTMAFRELEVGHSGESAVLDTALILRDSAGGKWRLTVSTTGALTVTPL